MATVHQESEILDRMRHMSRADISVLEACVKSPDSAMTTFPGSPNDVLWTEMMQLGWTDRDEQVASLSDSVSITLRIYKITQQGREPISNLLRIMYPSQAKESNQDRNAILLKIAPLIDEISDEITPRLINTVLNAGGDPSYILMFLAHVTARIMRRSFKPEDQKRALAELQTRTEQFFGSMSP